jgi:purine-binding chemotaxis protein CheW
MGIVVDRVCEVLDISGDNIELAPSFGAKLRTDFITGMGKIGDKVKILLDIEKVLTEDVVIAKGLASS